ncbi:MAG TPA: FAD-dependent oxidoreductase [Candidatus Acidoferrales bacterium]|nr:FAD-dependent oxidoreductase [Candidatus Acidoferrales bacterium]
MTEKFDSVVVGSGPAGIAAAYTMAKAGLSVLVLEKGEKPGAKNMFGGVIFRHHTEKIAPEFWKTAPVERHVVEYQYWFLSKESHVLVSHRNQKFNGRYNAFTVHRAKFDPWFSKLAEDAGALIINRTTVDDVIREDGKVVGVKTERGDVLANVVVAADGVNSMLSKQVGLREELPEDAAVLAVKEVIALPKPKIEERFNLGGDEGVAALLVGCGPGMHAGFMYTNRDTISLGMGVNIRDLDKSKQRPNDLFEQFKKHPSIAPLIKEGELKEYSAHLIPEGGYDYVSNVYTDGMLVAGDAAMLVNAINWEGTNLAMTSGIIAGETIIEAKKKGDFSSKTLSQYRQRLEESFVLMDLKKYREIPKFFSSNPHFFTLYPDTINELAYMWHVVDDELKQDRIKEMKTKLFKQRSKLGLLRDAYHMWRLFS